MKLISFSIWGNNPLYYRGMLANLRLIPIIYPKWTPIVYHDNQVPGDIITQMNALGAQTIKINKVGGWDGLFWRFYPLANPNIERLIVRDADSRVNVREKAAVDEWVKLGFKFHVMHDHLEHNMPILGGMFGCVGGLIPDIIELINKWPDHSIKGTDQIFLNDIIWPRVRGECINHDANPFGIFKLPNGSIKSHDDVIYYNEWDNCGDDWERYPGFPHGRIAFNDGSVFQRLDVYAYDPIKMFGKHVVKRFPPHGPLAVGTHVGEIINENL